MAFLKKIRFPFWTVFPAFLGIAVAAYGLLAHLQGYYWDDWGFAWLAHTYGGDGLSALFNATGRPWLGPVQTLTHALLGENPLAWQIFGILCRCLAALAFLWMLRTVWPGRSRQATWAALLFLVYPGFSQQFIAITYSHFFLIQAAFFASLGLTVLAIRRPDRAWVCHLAALLLSAFNLFMVEYLVVLELVRPLLAWWVIAAGAPSRRAAVSRLIRTWLPYVLLLTVYLCWRLFILSGHLYQPTFFSDLHADPVRTLFNLAGTVVSDMVKTSLLAWLKVFEFPTVVEFGLRSTLVYAALVVFGMLAVLFYLARFQPGDNPAPRRHQWLVTGLLTLFLAGWPFWIAQLDISLIHPNDRFNLAFMPGVSILLAGLADLLPERWWLKPALLSLLIALAVGLQFQNANLFRRDWKTQQSFFWQLAWRAPALEPGTTILSAYMLPMIFNSDDSLTAPLNWIYAPNLTSDELPYLMLFASERSWLVFEPGRLIQRPYPPALFTGTTSEMVVIHFAPPGCLRLLDPEYDQETPLLPPDTRSAMFLSDPDRVIPDPERSAAPPASLFGPEQPHGWCFYFEKAELARQQGDWAEVARLGDLAFNLDDSPNDASEYVVFIEGYAHAGRGEDAVRLTRRAMTITPLMQPMFCAAWQRVAGAADPGGGTVSTDMLSELACGQ